MKFSICGHDINLLERGLKSNETPLEAIAEVYMTYGDKLHQSSGSKYGEKKCWRVSQLVQVAFTCAVCCEGQESRLYSVLPGFKSCPFINLLCDLSKLLHFCAF